MEENDNISILETAPLIFKSKPASLPETRGRSPMQPPSLDDPEIVHHTPEAPPKWLRLCNVDRGVIFPFRDAISQHALAAHRITFVRTPLCADVLFSQTSTGRRFRFYRRLLRKPGFVWTNQTTNDTTPPSTIPPTRDLVIMNAFSGDVFWHNLHSLGAYHFDSTNDLGIPLDSAQLPEPLTPTTLSRRTRLCAALFVYKDPAANTCMIHGRDISLHAARQNAAIELYRRGHSDIVGSRWPADITPVDHFGYDAGYADWPTRKLRFLRAYRFNLCSENTAFPYYCTEKIWHSILAGCLPVYHAKGTAIYETFPKDSFIDASAFASPAQLADFLETLPVEEHLRRHHLCLTTMQRCIEQKLGNPYWKHEIVHRMIHTLNAFHRPSSHPTTAMSWHPRSKSG